MLNEPSNPGVNVALDRLPVQSDIPHFTTTQINTAALHTAIIMLIAIDTPKLFVITIDEIRARVDPRILKDHSDDYLQRIIHSLIFAGWLEPCGRGWVLTDFLARAAVRCRQKLHDVAMRAQRQSVDLYAEPEV